MNISLKEIISLIVKEVLEELDRREIKVEGVNNNMPKVDDNQRIKMDFSEYKTPVLTESHILEMNLEVAEIEVPKKTIITPSAQDLLRKRKIIITKL